MNIRSLSHLIILLLVFSVCMVSCVGAQLPDETSPLKEHSMDEETFQDYLWQEHPVDLMLQIGLLIAGALGVTALLPTPDEEQPTDD